MGITNFHRGRSVFKGGIEYATFRYEVNGEIDPGHSHIAALETPSAGTFTLGVPVRDGLRLDIISRQPYAHVVTATGLLDEGTTGGVKNKITFVAANGASATLISLDGFWNVQSVAGANIAK